MNKKKNSTHETSGPLSFKRETVRNLSADEVRQAAGGMTCQPKSAVACPGSACTMESYDATTNPW